MLSKKRLLKIVISAPSGAGKTTVIKELFKKVKNIERTISFTTRPRKSGEINGIDYYFISKKEFENKIKEREFIEYAKVHEYFYGTSKQFLGNTKGKDLILNIDVQGGIAIKKKFSDSILVFLMPPSLKELKDRLLKRKRDSKEEINKRIKNAKREIKFALKYDFIVINDKLKNAVDKLRAIIISERVRIKKYNWR